MKYTRPEIEVIELDNIDVIQTSSTEENTPDNEDSENRLPWG